MTPDPPEIASHNWLVPHLKWSTNHMAAYGGPEAQRSSMLATFLFLVLVCVIAGIIGFVVHGLLWLFVIACLLFILTLLWAGFRYGRVTGRSRK